MYNNNTNLKSVRVRFAPSPTGSLHLGNVRTAIFNWLFARHTGGKFILRIEDTDRERSTPESVNLIQESLKWFGLDWDEGPDVGGDFGPYYQMQRLDKYKKYINILIKKNMVYPCFCTPERLTEMRNQMQKQKLPPRYDGKCKNLSKEEIERLTSQGIKHVLRFRVPTTGTTEFKDLIHGKISIENSIMDDFIIVKSNDGPTYNFACVVDDIEMKITHVIRGDDHISNTPKQISIYRALGINTPEFAHIPLILGSSDKAKLSKRHGAASPLEYRDMGYLPHALLNFLTLLGWAPGDNRELMNRNEIIENFSIEKINDRNAVFDSQKLDWMNGVYIRKMSMEELVNIALGELKKTGLIKDTKDVDIDKISKIVGLIQERLKKFSEIPQLINYFFDKPIYEEKAVRKFLKKDGVTQMLQELCKTIEKVEPFDIETLESAVREFIEKKGLKVGKVIHPVRVALTGRAASPPIFDVMQVLGKQTCLKRIADACA